MLSCFSHVQLFATLWTAAFQAPLSMGFSNQESWSGLPCPPPGNLPDPGIELVSPTAPILQADSLLLSHQESPFFFFFLKAPSYRYIFLRRPAQGLIYITHSSWQAHILGSHISQRTAINLSLFFSLLFVFSGLLCASQLEVTSRISAATHES